MTKKKATFEIAKPKFLIAAAAAISAIVVGVYLFMTYVVLPAAGQFIAIDVPAKSGGETYYTNGGEFQSMSYVILGIAAVLLVAILILVAVRKYTAAFIVSFLYVMGGGFYCAIMLGNGFNELWGGWWSVLGVVISFILYFGVIALITFSLKNEKPRVNESK